MGRAKKKIQKRVLLRPLKYSFRALCRKMYVHCVSAHALFTSIQVDWATTTGRLPTEKRRPSGRRPRGSGRPLKIRASAGQSRASANRTTASGLRGEKSQVDIEQCRQGKTAKQIPTFGTRIGSRDGLRTKSRARFARRGAARGLAEMRTKCIES